ncbi:YjcZ family sporulation protein [Peribacillus tepidiphilus]|nr:YjcZ family sporulation protein [Peribacillus tepidiphilus]
MGDKGCRHSSGFALIVVLFILLIIVGAAWF